MEDSNNQTNFSSQLEMLSKTRPDLEKFINELNSTANKLKDMEKNILSVIKGQDDCVKKVCAVIRRGEHALTDDTRPKASFLFMGPTGVGKTELAIQFTREIFGSDKHFHRFDMSECQAEDGAKTLIGNPITKDGGRLARTLENFSSATLLFDEIEKAHRLVWDIFLQIFDAARVTLSNDKTYNLNGFYIVFTSNIGAGRIMDAQHSVHSTIERQIMSELKQHFRPELIGRMDDILVFRKLEFDTQRQIAKIMLEKEIARHKSKSFNLGYTNETLEFLIRKGMHKSLGARPMRKAISNHVQDAIIHSINKGFFPAGTLVPDNSRGALHINPDESMICLQQATA